MTVTQKTPKCYQEDLDAEFGAVTHALAAVAVDLIHAEQFQLTLPKFIDDEDGGQSVHPGWFSQQGQIDHARRRRDELSARLYVIRQRQLASWDAHGILTDD